MAEERSCLLLRVPDGVVVDVALDEDRLARRRSAWPAEEDGEKTEGILTCVFGKLGVYDFSHRGKHIRQA